MMVFKSNKNKKIDEILINVAIFLIIVLSGCVFFTQAYRFETTCVLFFVAVILYYRKSYVAIDNKISLVLPVIIVILLNYLLNIDTLSFLNLKDYLVLVIQIIALTLISNIITFNHFKSVYVDIMTIISIISLICFFVQLNFTNLVYSIANTQINPGYMINWFHTWGWDYIFERNAGPFWEPGAFQGYLSVALLFILNERRFNKNYIKIAVLTITLLTTMSTTGYIILFILFIYFIYLINKHYKVIEKKNILGYLAIILILLIIPIIILSSDTIWSKFSNENGSFVARYIDLTQGYKLIFDHPIIGYGIMSEDLDVAQELLGMAGNSSGFIAVLSYFGLFFGSIYLILIYRGLVVSFNSLNPILVIIVFTIIFMTEGVLMFPFYFSIIVFNWGNRKLSNRVVRKNKNESFMGV